MDDDPVARLGTALKRLRDQHGLTQDQVSMRAGYGGSRAAVGRCENATGTGWDKASRLISEPMIKRFDRVLGGHGELVRLHGEASTWLRRRRASTTMAMDSRPSADAPSDGGVRTEEGTTDRRQLGVAAGAAFAASLAERMATADPTSLRRSEIVAEVHRLPSLFGVVPDAELRARIEPQWMGVEGLLDRRLSRPVRDELGACAGLFCYYLYWIAYGASDESAERAYLDIARRHATETEDRLLVGAVASLHASHMRGVGDYRTAADIATRARNSGSVHPFVLGDLAAEEARAAAMLGDGERARRALADLEEHVWTGGILPGPEPTDEQGVHALLAVTLGQLGEGEAAESHARSSLDLLRGHPTPYMVSFNYRSLARAFVRRRRPEPEQAAVAAMAALGAVDMPPWRSVVRTAADMWGTLHARWPELPAVRDLGEQVVAARRALPAPPRTALA